MVSNVTPVREHSPFITAGARKDYIFICTHTYDLVTGLFLPYYIFSDFGRLDDKLNKVTMVKLFPSKYEYMAW